VAIDAVPSGERQRQVVSTLDFRSKNEPISVFAGMTARANAAATGANPSLRGAEENRNDAPHPTRSRAGARAAESNRARRT
jgi:hypothetical protein